MPDFDNESNWTIIHQSNRIFMGKPDKIRHLPITYINIPLQSDYFKIYVFSPSSKPEWWLAGRLTLFIGNPPDQNRIRANSYIIPLEFWQFAQFQISPENTYHLQFEAAWWLQDIEVEVKQYFEI